MTLDPFGRPRVALIGFISDIHGNIEALEAVLEDAETVGVDAMVCLGDVVGYGPDPGACLDLVAQQCDVMIRGNHDEALLSTRHHALFNPRAWRSIEDTKRLLEPGHLMLIESMRAGGELAGIALAHAAFEPRRYRYLYDAADAAESFEAMTPRVGVVGHTHLPSMLVKHPGSHAGPSRLETVALPAHATVCIPRRAKVILNPGSVGQPRDRNPQASWGVLDLERWTFQARRVAYDVRSVQDRMHELGLPEFHALRLGAGV